MNKIIKKLFPGIKGRIRLVFITIFSVTAVIFCLLIYLVLKTDLERIAADQTITSIEQIHQYNHPSETAYQPEPVAISTEQINTIIIRTMTVILITLLIGISGITLMTGRIFSHLLKPIKDIIEAGEAVAEGDLTRSIEIHRDDEIGEIALQLDMIITNFSVLLQDIKQTSSFLYTSVQDLSSLSSEIATTSNQQAASVREIVTTMEDVDRLSKDIHQKIEDINRISIDTKDIVQDGFNVINESLEKMIEIRESNSGTIMGMRELAEKIDNIWEIVNIINGIADQTKIIAFNAELEAAAAGDAGKNFQIVATEIRRLADNTVSSTSEIKQKITEIQHSSDRLIISSEEGTEKINAGLNLSENIKNRFDDIQGSSQVSVRSANQITEAVGQQVNSFEQVLLTLKQISAGIDSFVESVNTMSSSSEHLNTQAEHLNMIANEFKVDEE